MGRFNESIASRFIRYCNWLPDRFYLRVLFRLKMGYWPNFRHPKTFSEKIQWLKLYNRKPENTMMVDKYAVKDYVAGIIGKEYVIPTLGVWNKPEEIEWDNLPNKFVLKTTHGGGNCGVVICRDKSIFDKENAIDKLNKGLRSDIYIAWKEWPYKNVPRRIIAEKYIEPQSGLNDLPDYKFFCFNGEPKYCQVISGRDTKMSIDFFDQEWKHQPFHEPHEFPFADIEPQKPKHFELMWELARKLAKGNPFCRIDFYDTGNQVLFGEFTLFPTSGMGGFSPEKYDALFGEMININFR